MNTATMSQSAQKLLESLNSYEAPSDPSMGDIWQDVIFVEKGYSAELTDTLCSSEQADFVVFLDDAWWNFDCNEQTREWNVYYLGTSMEYKVDVEMVGGVDDDFDMGAFVEELQHNLPGMIVKNEPAIYSLSPEMRLYFGDKIDEIFGSCLDEVCDAN